MTVDGRKFFFKIGLLLLIRMSNKKVNCVRSNIGKLLGASAIQHAKI